jgi:hypothetical protein
MTWLNELGVHPEKISCGISIRGGSSKLLPPFCRDNVILADGLIRGNTKPLRGLKTIAFFKDSLA